MEIWELSNSKKPGEFMRPFFGEKLSFKKLREDENIN